jgi:hypothetical protein
MVDGHRTYGVTAARLRQAGIGVFSDRDTDGWSHVSPATNNDAKQNRRIAPAGSNALVMKRQSPNRA